MRDLHIVVNNKIATYLTRDGNIVCGNSDYRIVFTFDTEWDEYDGKVARFIWNEKYLDVAFNGNTVVVPMITRALHLKVGVYAGELCTTTPAVIDCEDSILCEHGLDEEPQHQDEDYKIDYRLPLAGEADEGKLLVIAEGAYKLKSAEELDLGGGSSVDLTGYATEEYVNEAITKAIGAIPRAEGVSF